MKTYLGLLLVLVLAGCGTPLKKQTLEPEANYWKFLTALSGEATGGDIT
jgi:hypothetical protein